jgi:predicted O-methyltransferase YrrM
MTTTPVVTQIEDMVRDVPGWSPQDQLVALFNLAYLTDAEGDIIELGSWCGRSATALGLAARLSGRCTVHAVDLFPDKTDWRRNDDGTYSYCVTLGGRQFGAYGEQTVWAEPFERDIAPIYERQPKLLDVFRGTIARNGLTDVVRPFRGDLGMFADAAPADLRCKLAFIDGDHSYDAVRQDIAHAERFLVPGGWICFDDAFSCYEGVDRAITDAVVNSGRYDRCQQVTRKFFVARRTDAR